MTNLEIKTVNAVKSASRAVVKFDEKFYMGMLNDALTVGLPIISTDTAARLMAITYVYGGGNETLVLSPKFQCDCKYIQKKFGIQGCEVPDAKFATFLPGAITGWENFDKVVKFQTQILHLHSEVTSRNLKTQKCVRNGFMT